MSVLTRVRTIFGMNARITGRSHQGPQQSAGVPFKPVRMDVGEEVEGGEIASVQQGAAPTPVRSKQEMIAELQKNYSEVLDLVRKMSAHLDSESERTARLMIIVERIPDALDALPELREQTRRMVEALRESSDQSRTRDEHVQDAMAHIRARLDDARESETHLVGTLTEFRGSLREMATSSERSSVALTAMNERNAARERELAQVLTLTRRWVIAAVAIGATGVLAAAGAVVFVLLQRGL